MKSGVFFAASLLISVHLFAQEKTNPHRTAIQRFAPIDMNIEMDFLSDSERRVLMRLGQVAEIIDRIYLNQTFARNSFIRREIAASKHPHKDDILARFDLHYGPWDTLLNDAPFYGKMERPAGAGVYPTDITKQEFNDWIADHPDDEGAFKSPYTVIRRKDDGLIAIPYSVYYAEDIERAATLMEEAANITEDEPLRTFLTKRAQAFRTDDYRESEMAWMDLEGTIEVAVGPYEVYTDRLFGLKTFFEIFITIRNPDESAKLERYKSFLGTFERNLPIADQYKNLKRGSESPLAVVDQVGSGGDAKPGVQTIAFNLPNDEVVREQKGSKKVLLKNVMQAKYEAILKPIADLVLNPSQSALVNFDYFFKEVLFHEMSHGLGPGTIIKNGEATTVASQLQETYSKIEEGKADIMGMYCLFYLMDTGELPKADRETLMATYFAGLFRSMRFGIHEAHGAGAAFQYNYFKEKKAFTQDENGHFTIDFDVMATHTTELVKEICMIQALGDYDAAKTFLETYAIEAPEVNAATKSMSSIPVDIAPKYPAL